MLQKVKTNISPIKEEGKHYGYAIRLNLMRMEVDTISFYATVFYLVLSSSDF